MAQLRSLKFLFYIFICIALARKNYAANVKNLTLDLSRHIRSLGFPEGSGMGVFFAIGVPVDIPDKSVSFSFYFEANYPLPDKKNSSEHFEKRSLDRTLAYAIVENKFASAGFPGRVCLLRTICEVAENQLTGNGLVGDLLYILFTPSSSRDEGLPCEISEAESTTDCKYRYRECPISLLDLISHYK